MALDRLFLRVCLGMAGWWAISSNAAAGPMEVLRPAEPSLLLKEMGLPFEMTGAPALRAEAAPEIRADRSSEAVIAIRENGRKIGDLTTGGMCYRLFLPASDARQATLLFWSDTLATTRLRYDPRNEQHRLDLNSDALTFAVSRRLSGRWSVGLMGGDTLTLGSGKTTYLKDFIPIFPGLPEVETRFRQKAAMLQALWQDRTTGFSIQGGDVSSDLAGTLANSLHRAYLPFHARGQMWEAVFFWKLSPHMGLEIRRMQSDYRGEDTATLDGRTYLGSTQARFHRRDMGVALGWRNGPGSSTILGMQQTSLHIKGTGMINGWPLGFSPTAPGTRYGVQGQFFSTPHFYYIEWHQRIRDRWQITVHLERDADVLEASGTLTPYYFLVVPGASQSIAYRFRDLATEKLALTLRYAGQEWTAAIFGEMLFPHRSRDLERNTQGAGGEGGPRRTTDGGISVSFRVGHMF